jgi:protein-tyrosine kinase
MSFIDKALEKAKTLQQKESAGAKTQEVQAPRPEHPEAPLPTGSPLIPGDKIDYTITQTVPVNSETLRRNKIITDLENNIMAEEFRVLRTQIMQRIKAENHNTLMVTGPLPGEGKTLCAINLAISISQEIDTTVLLVDADLRRPSIHRYFGLPPGPGLSDYLVGGVPISDLLIHPKGFSKFVILPGGKTKVEATELIGSPMMSNLVQELKHFYPKRFVIFDLPSLLTFADSMAFAPLMDAIILVVEDGRTPRESIQQCLEMLKGKPLLGCVLNKVSPDSPNSSYYYHQSYQQEKVRPSL